MAGFGIEMTEKLQDVKNIYDAFASQYRDYSKSKSAYIESIDALIVERFKGRVSDVLDFGAGDGVRGSNLFNAISAKNLIQTDISEEMLKRCRMQNVANDYWDVSQVAWRTNNQRFDLIMCLWNVLGHVPSTEDRILILNDLRKLVRPNGRLCLDVNNRHYIGYGKFNSLYRRLIDFFAPDYSRGDTAYNWNIGGVQYPAKGHLFIFSEIKYLLKKSGWKIESWRTVDYSTGQLSRRVPDGQLFFILVAMP